MRSHVSAGSNSQPAADLLKRPFQAFPGRATSNRASELPMNTLFVLAGTVLFAGFFGSIAWKLCTGEIKLDLLLDGTQLDSAAASGYSEFFSPGRAQLLFVTLISAGYYLLQLIHDPTRFPEIPTPWIVGLAGSQTIYLGGKAYSLFSGVRNLTNRRSNK